MHGGGSSSDSDQTWTADGSPHILPFDVTIYSTVTVEPCAEVLIAAGATVTVRGALNAEGTATAPIHFGAKDARPFSRIRLLSGTMRFAYARIDGGGDPTNIQPYLTGTLDLQGDNLLPTQELLHVDHVTVANSASNGVNLSNGAGFTHNSDALTITGSANYALGIFARSVGNIPAGTYTGNTIDAIALSTAFNESETTTLHDRGVPYVVGLPGSAGAWYVDTGPTQAPATLTIEAGVHMRFIAGAGLSVALESVSDTPRGSLVAVGTSDKHIVFTSDAASPQAGDWIGLDFGSLPSAINRLDFVDVAYAGKSTLTGSGSCPMGGNGINNAAIRMTGYPGSEFITNTTIVASASNGIDRGWRSDDAEIDFSPSNDLTGAANCQQTYAPTAANVCPVPVPCVH